MSYFPEVNINLSSVQRDKLAELRPIVIVAQASGSNFETKLYKDIVKSDINQLFGLNSVLSRSLLLAYKLGGKHDIYAIPLKEESGAVASQSTITITGSVVDTTQITLYCDNDVFNISVVSDDTINDIASKLATKINNASSKLFSASVVNNVITLTFNQKGVLGNQQKYSIVSLNSNNLQTTDVDIQKTDFAGGSGIQDIVESLSILDNEIADVVFDPYLLQDASNFNLIKNWTLERFNPTSDSTVNRETDNNVFFLEHNKSYSALYNKYNNNAIGDLPSLVVLSTEKSNCYPLSILSNYVCCEKLIVTTNQAISNIMTNKAVGEKSNLGVARGGMVFPYMLTSDSEKMSYVDVKQIQDLQICPVFNENGNLVIGEVFTQADQDSNEAFVEYPQQAILKSIRSNCFLIAKNFRHRNLDNATINEISTAIQNFLSLTKDWKWCAEEDFDDISNSLTLIKDVNNKSNLIISLTYKPINALKSITMNIQSKVF